MPAPQTAITSNKNSSRPINLAIGIAALGSRSVRLFSVVVIVVAREVVDDRVECDVQGAVGDEPEDEGDVGRTPGTIEDTEYQCIRGVAVPSMNGLRDPHERAACAVIECVRDDGTKEVPRQVIRDIPEHCPAATVIEKTMSEPEVGVFLGHRVHPFPYGHQVY